MDQIKKSGDPTPSIGRPLRVVPSGPPTATDAYVGQLSGDPTAAEQPPILTTTGSTGTAASAAQPRMSQTAAPTPRSHSPVVITELHDAPMTLGSEALDSTATMPYPEHDGSGPIALIETPPALKVETTPRPGLFASAFHSIHRLENRLLKVAGKDDPALTWEPALKKIDALGPAMHALTDEQLKDKTAEFKARIAKGEKLDAILPEAFAAAREAADRTVGMRPFGVQMLGGIVMTQGMVAEMGTGEGKTLSAVAPVYLMALAGKGAHIITVNETLAQRDAANNAPIFKALGMNVGVVLNDMPAEQKRQGYNSDVTYLTNSTLGFDYLRDNMAKKPEDLVLREPFFALVDEVDEVLIDEARTPLIIAQSTVPSENLYARYSGVVDQLKPGDDYEVDYKKKTVALTDAGADKVQKIVGIDLWASSDLNSMDDSVKKGQAAGQPVTVDFASKDEADRYLDQLKAQKRKFLVSEAACAHPVDTIGVTYPEAPTAHKAAPAPDNALLMKSSQFNHMDHIAYLDAALKAKTLFQRDRDYVVQERPEWTQQRDMAKVRLVFDKLSPAEQGALQQEAQHRTEGAVKSLATGQELADCPLKQWWDLMDPKPTKIPDTVLQAQFDAEGMGLMGEKLNHMSPDEKAALEAQARKIVGNDPQAKVNIVDEFTGRVLPGRRYSQGLHQAIEAKEKVEVQAETQTMASVTYPNLFRLYPRLAGMSGTAKTEEEELIKLYNMPVGVVPPNKPSQRKDLPDEIYMSRADKYRAIVGLIEQLHAEGQSVLVGTRSIEVNEQIAKLCHQRGLPINVLNAESVKNNTAAENGIIAQAGKSGAITIATNMAGRGVDIKPDRYNFSAISQKAVNDLAGSAMEARLKTLDALFAKQPADKQAAINQHIESELATEFRTQQRNALADKLPEQDIEDIRKAAGDPATIGMDAYRDNTLKALDQRLDKLPAKDRDALVGAAPSDDTRRNIRGVVITRELGINPQISSYEADHGVGIAFNPAKPGDKPEKLFESVDKMAGWLQEQGIPVAVAEPGVTADRLTAGKVTSIYPGASQHAPTVPADFTPTPAVPLPAFAQAPTAKPGLMIDSQDFPSQGLYVIGTERHESLRIDRQLCGRSGRQGEPGTTRFFLSMDDELMRFFGGENLKKMVQRMGMKSGEALSNSSVSNSIRKAQKAVEQRDFDSRTNTTKYDEVQNLQRETIYKERRKILMGYDLTSDVRDWADGRLDDLAADFKGKHDQLSDDDASALSEHLKETFGVKVDPAVAAKGYKAFVDTARKGMHAAYDARAKDLGSSGLRDAFLSNLDEAWHEQLDFLSDLQTGIGWVAVAQKNPEVEYKIQAGHQFEDMVFNVQDGVLQSIFKPDADKQAA